MFRTNTCGELTSSFVGKKVMLSGWVQTRRDLGGFIFIDLRDRFGVTQITFSKDENQALWESVDKLRSEYVIRVEGSVVAREKNNINSKLATGEIELKARVLEVLNPSEPLPFDLFGPDADSVNEELRLKYRFLDLRRPRLRDNILFRAKMIRYIRNWMENTGYTEFQTPILTVSSPEGSRDYLVPSRLHPGNFYALPQAPQQFKQLLMISGFDKYFQIAPCFRDEDARADRAPGEFYQLDVECSFKTRDEFLSEMEPLFIDLTEQLTDKKVWKKPFPRIPYKQALDLYGSDKPDLRYGLEFHNLTDWAKKSAVKIFHGADHTKGICVSGGAEFSRKEIEEEFEKTAQDNGAAGLVWLKVRDSGLEGSIAKLLTPEDQAYLIREFGAKKGDIIFIISAEYSILCRSLGRVRNLAAAKKGLADPKLIAWAWVVDFPMYEYNDELKKIDFVHNPFCMPQGGMKALSEMDPISILADQYDVVANGLEICSGSVRNNRPDIMYKAFSIAGYTKEEVDAKFGHMIRAFSLGAPPHCGFAPGIDRLVMLFSGEKNIREIIPFPKNQACQDLMMNAPGEVRPEQLRELKIKVDLKM
ncbi:MAG: aspartyl-tRNA synthetase [Parcubacteria group bacterium Gr01-1014_18]|nr:MAG: aspartyl-tRNA synthetase [Parcubacteria group bacterium Greene0416_36]TSC81387.1 MAG: aspartyl-tRNA synthetase [Parcubacteria group bacterium Gr01-1014_18]TSC99427.1 MAG: aspartyl-tRNA synthetase [Parcubacteria group bacterium Greene1014_20]TSD07654.1 MAG: aspartyl-tRNA synthetase [Parcubacteria group bacterium Greene0714_2]